MLFHLIKTLLPPDVLGRIKLPGGFNEPLSFLVPGTVMTACKWFTFQILSQTNQLAVLPPPGDVWLRRPCCFATQRNVATLPDHHVRARRVVRDVGRNCRITVAISIRSRAMIRVAGAK